ncbi:MAG: LysR family transcriptional regulator, partial [Desulfobacterales bacterium]
MVIIPTGSELITLEEAVVELPVGKTIESNSAALCGLAEQAGAEVEVTPIISDEYDAIKENLLAMVRSDAELVIINAGSSAGSADYTANIIAELGEVLTHGITIMPGKPTIFGKIDGKPVIGIPGYPVSAIIAMEQFVLPLLASMQGLALPAAESVDAVLARDLPSKAGIEEFRRMIVGRIGQSYIAVPLKKGAGAITTLTRANAMLKIATSSEGEVAKTTSRVQLLAPKEQIDRTILCTGSHDLSLDIWGNLLRGENPSLVLASSHVGSLGGILAIRDGMCHLAGSHLLDPEDGSYNISALRQYLPGRAVRLITLVHREQGFIVARGNPKGIASITDLQHDGVVFVNRQAGSGTRVLLDYELQKNSLDADNISGYDQDEYTHMAVAVAVLSGKADVG